MGFGFVEFGEREELNRAIDQLQGSQLDGHALELKLVAKDKGRERARDRDGERARDGDGERARDDHLATPQSRPTKILIKNIPFEASERDLRSLLTSFTPALKRLRLPRKFDGSLRGFGFAEFTGHAEAKHLMEQLGATHFYGRHLVLEWAKEE